VTRRIKRRVQEPHPTVDCSLLGTGPSGEPNPKREAALIAAKWSSHKALSQPHHEASSRVPFLSGPSNTSTRVRQTESRPFSLCNAVQLHHSAHAVPLTLCHRLSQQPAPHSLDAVSRPLGASNGFDRVGPHLVQHHPRQSPILAHYIQAVTVAISSAHSCSATGTKASDTQVTV
jgi:hypothetical protein